MTKDASTTSVCAPEDQIDRVVWGGGESRKENTQTVEGQLCRKKRENIIPAQPNFDACACVAAAAKGAYFRDRGHRWISKGIRVVLCVKLEVGKKNGAHWKI